MISIECDKCEKGFEAEDAKAGSKVECPFCGDINRVPGEAPKRSDEPVPDAARPVSADGEHLIRTVRPAMFRAHPFRGLLVSLFIFGGGAVAIASLTSMIFAWAAIPGIVVCVIGVIWWIAWWIKTTLWIRVEVTNKRTVRYEGIVRRASTEVLHDHVRSVDIQQGLTQRLFNVGYLGIDSAGQDGIEIEIGDIPSPYQIKQIIDKYRSM